MKNRFKLTKLLSAICLSATVFASIPLSEANASTFISGENNVQFISNWSDASHGEQIEDDKYNTAYYTNGYWVRPSSGSTVNAYLDLSDPTTSRDVFTNILSGNMSVPTKNSVSGVKKGVVYNFVYGISGTDYYDFVAVAYGNKASKYASICLTPKKVVGVSKNRLYIVNNCWIDAIDLTTGENTIDTYSNAIGAIYNNIDWLECKTDDTGYIYILDNTLKCADNTLASTKWSTALDITASNVLWSDIDSSGNYVMYIRNNTNEFEKRIYSVSNGSLLSTVTSDVTGNSLAIDGIYGNIIVMHSNTGTGSYIYTVDATTLQSSGSKFIQNFTTSSVSEDTTYISGHGNGSYPYSSSNGVLLHLSADNECQPLGVSPTPISDPVITLNKTSAVNRDSSVIATLSNVEEDVSYYYTLDDSEPSATNGTLILGNSFSVSAPDTDTLSSITVKVRGVKTGSLDSAVVSSIVTFSEKITSKLPNPVLEPSKINGNNRETGITVKVL